MTERVRARSPQKMGSAAELRDYAAGLGLALAIDDAVETGPGGPLATPLELRVAGGGRRALTNRFAILPMEGWDGTTDGRPSDLTRRRWRRFGESGATLLWGGEAVAVVAGGRANPNQLTIGPASTADLGGLRAETVSAHHARYGTETGLTIGLQLTHSGRWSRPEGPPAPRTAYRHPLLDRRAGLADASASSAAVFTDTELDDLVGHYVAAAAVAAEAGFDFVDVKACHGYLGHELLSGHERPGPYGGDLAGRTTFLRRCIEGIARDVPGMVVGVRLSLFDLAPFAPDPSAGGTGACDVPEGEPYPYAFGGDGTGRGVDLTETFAVVDLLAEAGVDLLCTTAGSPYYCPHAQRPATFPPSDGYLPPEDPLVGVARQLDAAAAVKRHRPATTVVGTGFSYLQEWAGHAGQPLVRDGGLDAVGFGRMVLSYPDLPADLIAGTALDGRRICRTFSDCTTAPRNGMVSGCYPLDDLYFEMPERQRLAIVKKEQRAARRG